MAIEEQKIEDQSSIKHRVSLATDEGRLRVLILRFEGEYRDGSTGSPDPKYITDTVS